MADVLIFIKGDWKLEEKDEKTIEKKMSHLHNLSEKSKIVCEVDKKNEMHCSLYIGKDVYNGDIKVQKGESYSLAALGTIEQALKKAKAKVAKSKDSAKSKIEMKKRCC